MSDQKLVNTPIVYIVFNRPELTSRSFAVIRKIRPERLFLIADGPRPNVSSDERRCDEVRGIISQIDWPCDVTRLYAEENLGCMRRITSGLDVVFATVSEAIILEDDCMPEMAFFRYCDELLERFRNVAHIGVVSGNNFQPAAWSSGSSYYFSRYPHCWGWATWSRAWQKMDRDMSCWSSLRESNWLQSLFPKRCDQWYWQHMFNETLAGRINSWAVRWALTCWAEGLLTVLPDKNLVTNVGFGVDSMNNLVEDKRAMVPSESIDFPMRHPDLIIRNSQADDYTQETFFLRGFLQRAKATLRFWL